MTGPSRRVARPLLALGLIAVMTACGASAHIARSSTPPSSATSTVPDAATSTSPVVLATVTTPAAPTTSAVPAVTPTPPKTTAKAVQPPAVVPPGTGPVIVIDPGHSPTISSTDPATGLNDSDYENEPEMRDVFAVAVLVKAQLIAAGYRVVMTKNSATDRISLGQRAAVANNAHAALALSIHDQAGSNGGIAFSQGNNIVYDQAIGDYRATPNGTKIYFTDSAVAATSQRYGQIFQTQRASAEGHSVRLQSNVGYDLGTRGLAAGNIWIVQLLSKVPWVYNEAGGNSPGQSGLNAADEQRYANGLVSAVEACVPA